MKILGIETSCDETAIAIVEVKNNSHKILSNIVSSQVKIHSPFGGVVPNLAAREHQKNLLPIFIKSLKEAKLFKLKKGIFGKKIKNKISEIFKKEPELEKNFLKEVPKIIPPEIDLIAFTAGPGLEIALWNGVNFAKALSYLWRKPALPINHLEGHIYSNLLKKNFLVPSQIKNFQFPILNLIVSGGHTKLVLQFNHGKYKVIGETRDDAAGEAFDKVARMLELGYPGGPIISKFAEKGNPKAFNFPRPMINQKNYDFSFAGLKTAVFYLLKDLGNLNLKIKRNICASFQDAVCDVLVSKTIRAAGEFKVKTIFLSGGVSANKLLRKKLKEEAEKINVSYSNPELNFTGDNAAMIALAAYYKKTKFGNKKIKILKAEPNLEFKNW